MSEKRSKSRIQNRESSNQACTSGPSPPGRLSGIRVVAADVARLVAAASREAGKPIPVVVVVNRETAALCEPAAVAAIVALSRPAESPDPKLDQPGLVSPEQAAFMVDLAIRDHRRRRDGALEVFVFYSGNGVAWSLPSKLLPPLLDGSYSGPGVQ